MVLGFFVGFIFFFVVSFVGIIRGFLLRVEFRVSLFYFFVLDIIFNNVCAYFSTRRLDLKKLLQPFEAVCCKCWQLCDGF